jgi:mannose-1-phosphate guanylyltransferase/mannose-1-phosphate guanylyltransferase/mannose-6-phosphate isomerase
VAGERHTELVAAQLDSTADATIIVEPSARNTAAAIALAALLLPEDAIMLVCPSDHHIGNPSAFRAASAAAARLAADGYLVSLGIEATGPETGYGYLERGSPLSHGGFKVARFVEKPDRATAEGYLASGRFAWNGGIFAFRVEDFLGELDAHAPDIGAAARAAVADGRQDGVYFRPAAEKFSGFVPLSVDYAVMEHTSRAAMVPADMAWSDIGSWDALHAALDCDASGNSIQGSAELVDCRNVLVSSDGPRVSAIGLDDVIVVVDGDEVLVTTKSGAQRVGKLRGAASQ